MLPITAEAKNITSPEEFLGHRIGEDYKLARYEQIHDYFQLVAKKSDRVNVRILGTTTGGRDMILAEITDSASPKKLARYRADQRKIADPRLIESDREERDLLEDGKIVVLISCSIHATEVGAAQMSMELLHELATDDSPRVEEILERVVVVIVPCANPDGLDIVADWYERSLGTPWEGTGPPWLYHPYAGHDNNRDWFMLNLKETRLQTKVLYEEWFPTLIADLHQMGNSGPRLFLPPFYDPLNPNIDPVIPQTLMLIGGHVAADLTSEGKKGVVHARKYDNWAAGKYRSIPYMHNMVSALTEMASVSIASPIFQRKSDLTGIDLSNNYPNPWPGGWWRLRDIVEYEKSVCWSIFTLAARYHETFKRNQILLGRKAIEKGKTEPPFAWLVPPSERDPRAVYEMLERFRAGGIEVHRAAGDFTADGVAYPEGTFVLYCAQPFRAYLNDMMERQAYPDREQYPGGPPESPYDIAGWTLPLQMGVRAVAVSGAFECEARRLDEIPFPEGSIDESGAASRYLLVAGSGDDYILVNRLFEAGIPFKVFTGDEEWRTSGGVRVPAGSILIEEGERVRTAIPELLKNLSSKPIGLEEDIPVEDSSFAEVGRPRLGLYQPWTANMDEGWTRLVLETFEFPYTSVHNADVRAGNLEARYDCIVLPSLGSSSLIKGKAADSTEPAYEGGIGQEGVVHLQDFVQRGGVLVCVDGACNFPIETFNIPVKNVVAGKKSSEFYCPGSLLRVAVDTGHPLGYGLPEWVSGFFRKSQAFEIEKEDEDDGERSPAARFPATVAARYSDTVLLESGWIKGGKTIADKPAVVEVQYGKGKIVLLGFRVQHRSQTYGAFRLLFNAILRGGME